MFQKNLFGWDFSNSESRPPCLPVHYQVNQTPIHPVVKSSRRRLLPSDPEIPDLPGICPRTVAERQSLTRGAAPSSLCPGLNYIRPSADGTVSACLTISCLMSHVSYLMSHVSCLVPSSSRPVVLVVLVVAPSRHLAFLTLTPKASAGFLTIIRSNSS